MSGLTARLQHSDSSTRARSRIQRMPKRRSKISLLSWSGLLFILLMIAAISGCKKEAPPPALVTPLPKKTAPALPAGVAPTASVKPIQAAPSTARKAVSLKTAQNPVQSQVSTAKQLLPPEKVGLDFTGRRDPFKPYVQMPSQKSSGRKGKTRDPLPIQSFDTEKFRVSGIITGLKENSALVIDPTGKGHIVKAGMPFGNNDGHVKRITSTAIEIEESFTDDNGRDRKRLVKLVLIRKK